jgi:hypothetical protein
VAAAHDLRLRVDGQRHAAGRQSSVMLFSSTLATAPVTVLRLLLSLLLPETVPPAAVEPALP